MNIGQARAATLAFMTICTAVAWGGEDFSKSSAATRASLRKSHTARAGKSCAPTAPIETLLHSPASGMVGSPISLKFDGILTQLNSTAEFRVDLPNGVRLVQGRGLQTGAMKANEAYSWNYAIVVDRPGTYEVQTQLIAGDKDYSYGQRRTLYIKSNGNQLSITQEKPIPTEQTNMVPQKLMDTFLITPHAPVGGNPPIEPNTETVDPFGMALDPKTVFGGGGIDAATSISGTWRYRHTDTTLHNGYGSWVEAWDSDTGADEFLDRANVASDGTYTLNFDNVDTDEGGLVDVYIRFRSENTRIQVHNNGGTTGYSTQTGVVFPNIASGSNNAGGYFADWGTNGVSDNNERAFQLADDMTTAWQHWRYYTGVLFDNRLTYVQWYIGSTDGAYYQTGDNRIRIDDNHVSSPDVNMHEYGHSLHDGLFDDVAWPPGAGGPHSLTGHYTPGLAWTEGFATYFCCTAQGDEWMYNDNSPTNTIVFNCDSNWDGNGSANGNSDGLSNNPNWGYDTESAVLAFQLDLDDARNSTTDPYDWSTLGDNEIFDVMRNYFTGGHRPFSVQEFFDGWHSIVDVQNPKINAQMHNHGMVQAATFPQIGLYSGVDRYSGTWYYGGYGRGSYDVRNYSSRSYDLDQCYVWLRGPANEDVGQFGGDGNGTPLTSGEIRNVWEFSDQTGYSPSAPNFVYGTYTITAGFYRPGGLWTLLEPAETGTDRQISVNVVEDTDAPDSCTANDDGAHQISLTTVHVSGTAFDGESSIRSYWTQVGTTPGAGNIQSWIEHAANNQTSFDYNLTGMAIPAGTVVYVTVVARNIEGLDTWAYTDGIKCGDTTAPGAVTVTDQGFYSPSNTQLNFLATTSEPDGGILMWWTRVGTTAGLGNVQDWVSHDVHLLNWNHSLTGLTMPTGSRYFITAVARNYGIMDTFGYSNGILSPLYAASASVESGVPFGGAASDLQTSDNEKLYILNDELDPVGQLRCSATSPVFGGSNMHVIVEINSTHPQMIGFVDMFNYNTNTWQMVSNGTVDLPDQARTIVRPGAANYINQITRNVSTRLRFIPSEDLIAEDGWSHGVDRLNWYVEP